MMTQGRLKYLAYYNTADGFEKRSRSPAACAVIDYVVDTIAENGQEIELISTSNTEGRKSYCGKTIRISDKKKITYLRAFSRRGKIWNKFSTLLFIINRFFKLLFCIHKNDTLIVYHSLGFLKVVHFLKRLKGFKLILSVQEIYADVLKNEKLKKKELKYFKIADSYIFPTELLNKTINTENKPYVIIHGTYKVEQQIAEKFNDGKIHCVYAGTFDPRKGGVAATAAGEFLDERYHVHIIGFGSEEDKKLLITTIEKVSQKTECKITYDGLLSGEEYIKFIQSCHIGLSTQNPNAEFNDTSFPSKVLSYLANGLRVVTIRIKALETSAVNDLLYYYDENAPKKIAETIKQIEWTERYDSRQEIERLHGNFKKEIMNLIQN